MPARLLVLLLAAGCASRLEPDVVDLRKQLAESEQERARLEKIVLANAEARKLAETERLLREGLRFLEEGRIQRGAALLRAALALDPPPELVERVMNDATERMLINLIAAGGIEGASITRADAFAIRR